MSTAPFDLTGKHALVTGGGSGIGLAICRTFAARGCRLTVLELNAERGERALNDVGVAATVLACDVSDFEQVSQVVSGLASPADLLINNAGIAHIGKLGDTRPEDLDRIYAVNVRGVYNCAHAVLAGMQALGGGVILNLASVASVVGIADRFAYSMSKGAVLTMTYSIAKDYLADGIRCNCIAPARVHTPFVDNFIARTYPGREEEMFARLSATQPIGRMGTPEEVAHLALYLCSDEASFITGSCYPIDGGFVTLNT